MKLVRLGVAVALIALAVPVIAQIRFSDVPDDHRYADAIRWAAELDEPLFRGYPDGSFRPDRQLSDNEFRIVVRRLYDRYDGWTRAEVAQFLRHGIVGIESAPPAPTTTRPATPTTTTAPTTTRPATPTTTRESVLYYAARGAEWAARAAEYRPDDVPVVRERARDREWAVIAYNLASASYYNACGALKGAGLGPIARYMSLADLASAAANGFADNPDAAASAAVIGYCDTALLYSIASDNLRFKTPQADHSFGNARHHHDFAALAAEYSEIGAAGLRAANHLLTGGYDFIFAKHNALTAPYKYSSAAHYAAQAAEVATNEHSKAAWVAEIAARYADEIAADYAAEAADNVIHAAAAAGGSHWTHNTDNYLDAAISADRHAAAAAAETAGIAAAHAAEYAGIAEHTAGIAARYADEWASADPDADYDHYTPAGITAGAAAHADFAARRADFAARYSAAAAEWASYAAAGR